MWFFRTDAEKARAEAEIVLERHKGLGEAYLIRGAVGGSLPDLDRAVELLDTSAAYTARGDARIAADRDGAIADYTRAIERQPANAVAHNHRGVARGTRDLDAATADFDAAIRLSPTYAMAYKNRAVAKLNRGDFAGALRDAERALELAPPEAWYRDEIETLVARLKG